jgi:hypothetical protein
VLHPRRVDVVRGHGCILPALGVEELFLSGAHNPTGVAVDAAHLYWATFAANAIGRAGVDGSDINQRFIADAFGPEGWRSTH